MSTESFPVERPPARPLRHPRLEGLASSLEDRLMSRAGALTVVAFMLAVSLVLRTSALGAHLWVDEGLSVGIAQHPLSAIPGLLREDGSPPLYYLLLHIWISLAGDGERATHVLSLIFATLAIPAAYWAGSSLAGRRAALVCALLAAGLPYLDAYAQETRMYALLLLLSILAAASFVHVFVYRRRRMLPVFVVTTAASLYTHNWSLFLAAVASASYLVCVRDAPGPDRHALWRDGAIAFGAIAILYLPWVPTLLETSRHTGAPWALPPVVWSITQGLYAVVGGRGSAVALLFGAGAGILALTLGRPAADRQALAVKVLLLLGLGTLAVAFVYAKTTPAWALRYFAVLIGPLLLAFGLGLARGGRLAAAALVVLSVFWVFDPRPTKADWKSNVGTAIAQVRAATGSEPLILSTQPEQIPTIHYYLRRPARYLSPLGIERDPRMLDWRDALAKLRRSTVRRTLTPALDAVTSGGRVVLVTPLNLPKKPAWMLLIKRATTRWTAALQHDRRFQRLASVAPHQFSAGLAVRVSVFERR